MSTDTITVFFPTRSSRASTTAGPLVSQPAACSDMSWVAVQSGAPAINATGAAAMSTMAARNPSAADPPALR